MSTPGIADIFACPEAAAPLVETLLDVATCRVPPARLDPHMTQGEWLALPEVTGLADDPDDCLRMIALACLKELRARPGGLSAARAFARRRALFVVPAASPEGAA